MHKTGYATHNVLPVAVHWYSPHGSLPAWRTTYPAYMITYQNIIFKKDMHPGEGQYLLTHFLYDFDKGRDNPGIKLGAGTFLELCYRFVF